MEIEQPMSRTEVPAEIKAEVLRLFRLGAPLAEIEQATGLTKWKVLKCLGDEKRTSPKTTRARQMAVQACQLFHSGKTVEEIATQLDRVPATVRGWLKEARLLREETNKERILALFSEGRKVQEIATVLGLSKEHVDFVISRARRKARLLLGLPEKIGRGPKVVHKQVARYKIPWR